MVAIPEPYNLTLLANTTGYTSFIKGVSDTLMGGYFGLMVLITIYIITLLAFIRSTGSIGKAMVGSSYIIFVLSLLLWSIGFISDTIAWGSLIILTLFVLIFWNFE